ncbi:hypothetical protein O0544_17290 [Edwardsiella anguillarum]|nr:hypothetical protein [Edwardsiella anguillarum]
MTTLPLPESDCELVIAANTPVLIKASRAFMISQCPHGNAGDLIELATRHADQSVTPFARAELKPSPSNFSMTSPTKPPSPRVCLRTLPGTFPLYLGWFLPLHPYSWRWNPAVWVLQFAPTEILAEAHR